MPLLGQQLYVHHFSLIQEYKKYVAKVFNSTLREVRNFDQSIKIMPSYLILSALVKTAFNVTLHFPVLDERNEGPIAELKSTSFHAVAMRQSATSLNKNEPRAPSSDAFGPPNLFAL